MKKPKKKNDGGVWLKNKNNTWTWCQVWETWGKNRKHEKLWKQMELKL